MSRLKENIKNIDKVKFDFFDDKWLNFYNNPNNFTIVEKNNDYYLLEKGNENDNESKRLSDDNQKEIKDIILSNFCPVIYDAYLNNHGFIMTDTTEIEKINSHHDWIESVKIYNSVTNQPIKDSLQPKFQSDDLKNICMNGNVLFFSIEKFKEIIHEFFNFLQCSKIGLRFKHSNNNNEIEEYYIDLETNKELHVLRQFKRNSSRISGMDVDPRIKAMKEYEDFKNNKIELIENNDKFEFIFSHNKEKIPEHLQPIYKKNCNTLELTIPSYHNDDPRLKAFANHFNKDEMIFNEESGFQISNIFKKKITNVGKKLKDGSHIIEVEAIVNDENHPVTIQIFRNGKMKIYAKVELSLTDGEIKIKSENKFLCKRCEKFVFQIFDNKLCVTCFHKILKRKNQSIINKPS
jgi:hypothetical protein